MIILKPQDVAIALKLMLKQEPWTIASLAGELVMSASEVHAGLHRTRMRVCTIPMSDRFALMNLKSSCCMA